MNDQRTPAEMCHEIEGEVQEVPRGSPAASCTAEQFRAAVLTIEANKVKRFGFTLFRGSRRLEQDEVHLCFADTGELCATMEFDPMTDQLSVDHVCK
jgi:hypothetical protein